VELVELRLPPRSYRAEGRWLQAELARSPATIAHAHGYHADWVGLRAARAVQRPIVSTVHGFTSGDWKNRLYEWLDRRALRKFDAVVAVSRPLQDRLRASGVAERRLHLIRNAWAPTGPCRTREEARRALGLPPTARIVGWVGRLTAEKGPDVFVTSLARTSPTLLASVLGDGPLRPSLEATARRLGLGLRLRWHGVVPHAGELLPAFDLLVLSSRTEGTPMVLLEALAAGVPVVATGVGGIPDVVTPGEALLVPPERPDILAQAVEEVLADAEAARRRSEVARRRLVAEFALDPWLDSYETLYRSVSRSRAQPGSP
jgi:glycosyltransferase involved in cell wall biosynthesis